MGRRKMGMILSYLFCYALFPFMLVRNAPILVH
jgi:hypothetical protein